MEKKMQELNALIESAEVMMNEYIHHLDSPVALEEYNAWSEVYFSLMREKADLLKQIVLNI